MKKILTLILLLCATQLFAAGDDPMVLVYDCTYIYVPIGGITPGGSVYINWGDGTDTTVTEADAITHDFTKQDFYQEFYTVKISGDLTHFGMKIENTDIQRLNSILSWGNLPLTSLRYAFYSEEKLDAIPATLPSSVTDLSNMFNWISSFSGDISNWDVSNVTNMDSMFFNASQFNGDISRWNVSNVTSVKSMFYRAWSFSGDLSKWKLSKVTDLSNMFQNAESFNCDLSSWDVSHVTNMSGLFSGASRFNSDLSSWDVSHVTDLSNMFNNAESFNCDLSSWDVSYVTNMRGLFYGASRFNSDLSSWDVSNVEDMTYMFTYAKAFDCDLSHWDISNVIWMNYMFGGATGFNGDLSSWDVSNVTNMQGVFADNMTFNGDLSSWDVSNVTNMQGMFANATSFNNDLSNWNVSNVTDMRHMFENATSFNNDLSNWNISNVISMRDMFSGARSFNCDLSNWDISNVGGSWSTQGLLNSSALSISNYDKLLNGWMKHNSDRVCNLGAYGLFYSNDAVTARTALINKQWTINGDSLAESIHTVTYDENYDGGVATATELFSPAAKYVSPSYFPKREGYKLVGWNSKPDGSGYAFDNSIKITEDITFYAQWVKGTAIIQTDDNPISGTEGLFVSPNPVSQSAGKVALIIPSDLTGNWQVGVYDVLGNELDGGSFTAQGGTTYEWDLCNKSGVKVAGGSYVIRAVHTDKTGREKSFKRTVGVVR